MEIIKLNYTEDFIKRAVKSYWWKQVGPLLLGVTAAISIFIAYLVFNDEKSWLVGLLVVVVMLAIIITMIFYFVHLTRALRRLRRMKRPEATLELTENRFCVASDVGKLEFEWSIISQAWRFKEAWLLFFSAGEFMTLPVAEIPEKHKAFILTKLKENGAEII